jgi:hypothetical protein
MLRAFFRLATGPPAGLHHATMKPHTLLSLATIALLAGCASPLSNKVHTLDISNTTTKGTAIIAPPKATDFTNAAARQSGFVEHELRAGTGEGIEQIQRFQRATKNSADATIVFDTIRHGVTNVGSGLFAPTVEAVIRIVGTDGKVIASRQQSATSGEIHPLDAFVKNPELYRNAVSVASKKLGLELASGL